ncbi:MAG: hypothetical protein LC118_22000 [Dehalococcoidia bacterium]|nr:hypothetical protein [Dehalococcoidia bacterium]
MRAPRRGTQQTAHSSRQLRAIPVVLIIGALLITVLGIVSPEGGLRFSLVVVVAYASLVTVVGALSPFERLPRRRSRRATGEVAPPAFVKRTARELELASGTAARFEQLRVRLREIAEQRLAGRGLRFESEQAREVLGDEAWRLLDRPLERDKFAPGPPAAEIEQLLLALEHV